MLEPLVNFAWSSVSWTLWVLLLVPVVVIALMFHVVPSFTLALAATALLTVQVLVSPGGFATMRFAIMVPVALPLTTPEVVYWNVLPDTEEMPTPEAAELKFPLAPETCTTVPLPQPLGSEPVSVTMPVVVVAPVGFEAVVKVNWLALVATTTEPVVLKALSVAPLMATVSPLL